MARLPEHASCALAVEERNSLFAAKIIGVISSVLLSTTSEAARARPPFYAESVVMEAIHKMPAMATREENLHYLWTQVETSSLASISCTVESGLRTMHWPEFNLARRMSPAPCLTCARLACLGLPAEAASSAGATAAGAER